MLLLKRRDVALVAVRDHKLATQATEVHLLALVVRLAAAPALVTTTTMRDASHGVREKERVEKARELWKTVERITRVKCYKLGRR